MILSETKNDQAPPEPPQLDLRAEEARNQESPQRYARTDACVGSTWPVVLAATRLAPEINAFTQFLSNLHKSYPNPRISMDTNILAILIATVSSFVFVLVILLLLLYQRDPQCCQFLCSCRFFQGPSQCDCPPPYFSNNQDLVRPSARSQPSERMRARMQGDEVFCVSLPSNYQLPPWCPPRLPSYESVRKKDRQQQIHRLIAHRFGLWASRELPPTYEESLGPLPEVPPSSGSAHPFQRTTAFPTQRNTAV